MSPQLLRNRKVNTKYIRKSALNSIWSECSDQQQLSRNAYFTISIFNSHVHKILNHLCTKCIYSYVVISTSYLSIASTIVIVILAIALPHHPTYYSIFVCSFIRSELHSAIRLSGRIRGIIFLFFILLAASVNAINDNIIIHECCMINCFSTIIRRADNSRNCGWTYRSTIILVVIVRNSMWRCHATWCLTRSLFIYVCCVRMECKKNSELRCMIRMFFDCIFEHVFAKIRKFP